jgi:5-methylcytosine-specific restriction protein A
MSWRDNYRPPNWTSLRRLVLTRDNHTCQLCGDSGNEVDHMIPAHLGGSHDPDNLTTLCRACHDKKTRTEINNALSRRKRLQRLPKRPHPGDT